MEQAEFLSLCACDGCVVTEDRPIISSGVLCFLHSVGPCTRGRQSDARSMALPRKQVQTIDWRIQSETDLLEKFELGFGRKCSQLAHSHLLNKTT